MNMKKEDMKMDGYDKDNMRVIHPHFQKVFNNHQGFSVLDLIKQQKNNVAYL